VGLASRGQRNLDTGVETVGDAGELAQLKRQARGVHAKAIGVAVLLTAAFTVLH
jgi:predicted kinase